MNVRRRTASSLLLAFLAACSAPDEDASSAEAAQRADATLTIATTVSGTTSARVAVGGVRRMPGLRLPDPQSCGQQGSRHTLGTDPDNFAYVEVQNPMDAPASVALSLASGAASSAGLYVYASPTPPRSEAEADACLTADYAFFGFGSLAVVDLSRAQASSVVVPARGSVHVLVATGRSTGAFTLTARTEALASPPSLEIGPPESVVTSAIAVSGAERLEGRTLPVASSCGEGGTRRPLGDDPENYAYVEVKNSGDTVASVALSLFGDAAPSAGLYAYGADRPPRTAAAADACFVADQRFSMLRQQGIASLSAAQGNSLVVPAHASTFVLVATGKSTGAFTLTARTESVAPSETSFVVPAAGTAVKARVAVTGAQKLAGKVLPAPSGCGQLGARRIIGNFAENYSYLELVNPGDEPAVLGLSLAPGNALTAGLYAYASPTPPVTPSEADACLVADYEFLALRPSAEVELSPAHASAVVVPPRSSTYVLVTTGRYTGIFDLILRR